MTTNTYKLTYFDGRGVAEVSRLVFAAAGVPFEDHRIPLDDDRKFWKTVKDTYMFQKLPELSVNETFKLPQSKTIERFLAKRFGLFGDSETETALIDCFCEQVRDIYLGYNLARGNDEKVKKFWDEDFPNHITQIARNSCKNGNIVGDKLSLADIHFYYATTSHFDAMDKVNAVLGQHEHLLKVRETVANNERVKAYVSKRPVTPF